MVKIPKISLEKRKNIINLQKKIGQKIFYQQLIQLDPKVKKIININDIQRSIRAYEVKKYIKKSLVDWHENTKSFYRKNDFIKIYLDCPRDVLLERIKIRTHQMLKKGAIKGAKKRKIKMGKILKKRAKSMKKHSRMIGSK